MQTRDRYSFDLVWWLLTHRMDVDSMRTIAVVSDTHGVADDEVVKLALEAGATLFLHAGDVGHHGFEEGKLNLSPLPRTRSGPPPLPTPPSAAEVLAALRLRSGLEVAACSGNVDDGPGVALPGHLALELEGWKVLVTHIVGRGQAPSYKPPSRSGS